MTTVTSLAVAMLIISGCASAGSVTSFLRSYHVSEKDAVASLASELADVVDHGRLLQLEDALRVTYASLPKNADGNLDHNSVRYVLHRLFVQRHGWYIKGLEPRRDVLNASASAPEWVPTFLQTHLEQQLGEDGASLHELAALAATIEDLIQREAVGRLETAYQAHEFPVGSPLPKESARDVVNTYYVAYLLAGRIAVSSVADLEKKKHKLETHYRGWEQAVEWFNETLGSSFDTADGQVDFATASHIVGKLGENYHKLNDRECRSLKTTLSDMEDRKEGRVRLSSFYSKGLYSHWNFNEKIEYLRDLGALDESDPAKPLVIAPNYLMSRSNCLEATDLYAVCCRNECEDLMGSLERSAGAAEASPEALLDLVSRLPSDTVQAPRQLPEKLAMRLREVAATNGGQVPLHGRLFAQWMHHAYPRECPYPHESGTTSPMTPAEWMKEKGHESTSESEEVRRQHAAVETCNDSATDASTPAPTVEYPDELPWSDTEELLTRSSSSAQPRRTSDQALSEPPRRKSGFPFDVVLAAMLAASLSGLLIAEAQGKFNNAAEQRGSACNAKYGLLDEAPTAYTGFGSFIQEQRVVLAAGAAASALYALGLLDMSWFLVALCMGSLMLFGRVASEHRLKKQVKGGHFANVRKCHDF